MRTVQGGAEPCQMSCSKTRDGNLMSTRLDLPPIARRLNERLLASKQAYRTDDDTAAMVGDLRSLIVDAVTELENDVIINNNRSHSAATQSIGLATPLHLGSRNHLAGRDRRRAGVMTVIIGSSFSSPR